MYNIVKPFNIRWDWGRYLGKLRELQTSTECNHDNPVSSNHHMHTVTLRTSVKKFVNTCQWT